MTLTQADLNIIIPMVFFGIFIVGFYSITSYLDQKWEEDMRRRGFRF